MIECMSDATSPSDQHPDESGRQQPLEIPPQGWSGGGVSSPDTPELPGLVPGLDDQNGKQAELDDGDGDAKPHGF